VHDGGVSGGVVVTSAAESAARDRAAIGAGVPSRALMRAAGIAAAGEIVRRFAGRGLRRRGVAVFAGPGNNGGDAWVVAGALAVGGIPVRVTAVGETRTPDAIAERAQAIAMTGVVVGAPTGAEPVVVDGLLGTGSSGAPRGAIGEAVARIAAMRAVGSTVVALDVPTGVDATTGAADGALAADVTLTFGTMKRGLLVARAQAGTIILLDIGLGGAATLGDGAPVMADADWVGARVPPIAADAHKGIRRRVAIVAGGPGMVGAALLAARAAHASGVGLVRLFVAAPNVSIAQIAGYESLAYPWPADDDAMREQIAAFAHAVLLGPGLGTSEESRDVAERVLRGWHGPTVVDADALNLFAGHLSGLAGLLDARAALITPHPQEFARLTGLAVDDVLAQRFDVGSDVARTLGAAVLLKGVPTVVTGPGGERVVSAAGSPVLAAGGSGDLLAGIAVTMLAQTGDPVTSAGVAAWVHGRAAELAGGGRVRGVTLDDVVEAMPAVWESVRRRARSVYPVLAELPRVGE
jgi:ADP-dependent NAD(P)H-hydrate dehydratase / NAD(P)H-hydrate epimerase